MRGDGEELDGNERYDRWLGLCRAKAVMPARSVTSQPVRRHGLGLHNG